FFSSRRRHTRSDRDWSSDVCSSDLLILLESQRNFNASARQGSWQIELSGSARLLTATATTLRLRLRRRGLLNGCWRRSALSGLRSEERRVGKEGGSGGGGGG